jgi:DNA-binding NtrC family response regulator
MNRQGNLLVVDDNKAILTAVEMLARDMFDNIYLLSSPERIRNVLEKDEKIDVVLLDMNFEASINTGNEGLFWLQEIKKMSPSTRVVLFTAYADIDLAVKGVKLGAIDFVVKPWDNHRLRQTLASAYAISDGISDKKDSHSADTRKGESMYWGVSKKMTELRKMIEKVAATDANILITGENGTGKDILAKEIHRLSCRRNKDLVTVDMGAVTETLFESELFGHVKGAFTDARSDRAGKFEAADGGTLFLDEIGNLPYHLQSKLLTVLQSRSVVRVGSNEPKRIDIRLITATNKDIKSMVSKGEFREDLLYRINTIHVELPPLRERKEDIVPFAEMFLERYSNAYGKSGITLGRSLRDGLLECPFMGNIRELQHAVEKAVIMASDGQELAMSDMDVEKSVSETVRQEESRSEIKTLEEMEYDVIKECMKQNDGNLSLVASQLGISRQTLYNKLKRYGL